MDWQRLAEQVEAERTRQSLSRAQLARRAGFSARTMHDIANAKQDGYRPETLDRLETALRWEPGSVERVLRGGSPRGKADPDLARIQHAWRDLPPAVRRVLADVAEHYRP